MKKQIEIIMPDNSTWLLDTDDVVIFLAKSHSIDFRISDEAAEKKIRNELTAKMVTEKLDWNIVKTLGRQISPANPNYEEMFYDAEIRFIEAYDEGDG